MYLGGYVNNVGSGGAADFFRNSDRNLSGAGLMSGYGFQPSTPYMDLQSLINPTPWYSGTSFTESLGNFYNQSACATSAALYGDMLASANANWFPPIQVGFQYAGGGLSNKEIMALISLMGDDEKTDDTGNIHSTINEWSSSQPTGFTTISDEKKAAYAETLPISSKNVKVLGEDASHFYYTVVGSDKVYKMPRPAESEAQKVEAKKKKEKIEPLTPEKKGAIGWVKPGELNLGEIANDRTDINYSNLKELKGLFEGDGWEWSGAYIDEKRDGLTNVVLKREKDGQQYIFESETPFSKIQKSPESSGGKAKKRDVSELPNPRG